MPYQALRENNQHTVSRSARVRGPGEVAEILLGQDSLGAECETVLRALFTRGQFSELRDLVDRLLAKFSDSFFLNNLAGATYSQLGQYSQAEVCYRSCVGLSPSDAVSYYNLGTSQLAQHKNDEARRSLETACGLRPDYAHALNSLGVVQKIQKDYQSAVASFSSAVKARPDFYMALVNRGATVAMIGDTDGALRDLEGAVSVSPGTGLAYRNMGAIYMQAGDADSAIKSFKKAVECDPADCESLCGLGNGLKALGKSDQAVESYKKAISANPQYVKAHKNLSAIHRYTPGDQFFSILEDLYNSGVAKGYDLCELSFALAKAYEDTAEIEKAFGYLRRGNACRKEMLGYEIEQDRRLFSALRRAQPLLEDATLDVRAGDGGPVPIFIVGMPRSGTTLAEQIISGHSSVTGGGELPFVDKLGKRLATDPGPNLGQELVGFRRQYLEELQELSGGRRFVTDKMPHNFRYLPLILAAFPEAKVVHVTRDPAATCWSNYKSLFPATDLGYSNDLDDLVSYYGLYTDLMRLWDTCYPGSIYHLDYDRLTEDSRTHIGRLLEALDLPPEAPCLSPHLNGRAVLTRSDTQVRRPIYKNSSSVWKVYQDLLGGAFDTLEGFSPSGR